ncbi:phosphotransferase [Paenibacillus thermotolerans]|uniref:phosphotransferase n=1 Tax=Paenibacillus thermotolerans TaxID=3027807 RepID=UPI0023684578|nr:MULTISPECIES: phosphotransferase [unclassified Paenibacillus]
MAASGVYPAYDPLFRHIPDRTELEAICKHFGLGAFLHNHGDLGGAYNANLKIETDKGMFVCRIAFGLVGAEHIDYSLKVLSALEAADVPVLFPLINEQGIYYTQYKDRFLQVTPFIEGKPFDSSVEHARTNGRLLRKMHDVLASFEAGPKPEWSNYPSNEILSEGLKLLRETCNPPEELMFRAERLYDLMMPEWCEYGGTLPETVIHGDWHTGNVLYGEDGDIRAVMDFDFVQRAERLHDIAYMLWALLQNDTFRHLGKAFLEGYGDLTPAERNVLPIAVARAALFFVCTSSFHRNPSGELNRQLEKQEPLIDWLVSEADRSVVADLL